jgi:Na+-transporting NADH:ubiquinone oxidoreductase subunit B/electron transport complex protein RnfD
MNDKSLNVQNDAFKKRNTWLFAGSLAILLVIGTFIFGWRVLLLAAVSFAVSLVIDYVFATLRKKPFDSEWMITPLLVVLILPPAVPAWLVGIATFFAVFFGKNIFGGSGKYIFSPALVGVLFVLISFLFTCQPIGYIPVAICLQGLHHSSVYLEVRTLIHLQPHNFYSDKLPVWLVKHFEQLSYF